MRLPLIAVTACLLLGPTACASDHRRPVPDPVRLTLTGAGDGQVVRQDSVVLGGRVRPSTATVLVGGRRAAVLGGRFSARVPLQAGVNVIDVVAGAGRARPALTAIRIRRVLTVAVPDLSGESAGRAARELDGLGLNAGVQDIGDLLDRILGGDKLVCASDPAAGSEVDAGSTVTLQVSRRC